MPSNGEIGPVVLDNHQCIFATSLLTPIGKGHGSSCRTISNPLHLRTLNFCAKFCWNWWKCVKFTDRWKDRQTTDATRSGELKRFVMGYFYKQEPQLGCSCFNKQTWAKLSSFYFCIHFSMTHLNFLLISDSQIEKDIVFMSKPWIPENGGNLNSQKQSTSINSQKQWTSIDE